MRRLVLASSGILIAAAVGYVAWRMVILYPRDGADPVALYTWWLSGFTLILGLATIGLVIYAARQFGDSRLNNRAYISVEPRGLEPWRGEKNRFLGHLGIVNAGVLPARNLKWAFKIEMTDDGDRKEFPMPLEDELRGNQLVIGHSEMKRGSVPITIVGLDYCFIWGKVTYEDGFGRSRTTEFCHRYNCDRDDFRKDLVLPAGDGRQHEYGNFAN